MSLMQRRLHITQYAILMSFLFLLSCTTPAQPLTTSLVIYRFDPPAFLEYSQDLQLVKEIPFSIPPNCGLYDTFPAPVGKFLLIELSCPNGQTVLFLDIESGASTQPVTSSDAHFLAWTLDGKSAYLKVDSLGNTRVIRAYTNGDKDFIPITAWTYDLSPKPDSGDFTFTFSRGLGQGSELDLPHTMEKLQSSYMPTHTIIFLSHAFHPMANKLPLSKFPIRRLPS